MSSIRSPEGSRTNWTSPLPGVLPAEVRRRLDLQEGDRIMLSFDDEGSMRLCTAPGKRRDERGVGYGGSPRPYEIAASRKN